MDRRRRFAGCWPLRIISLLFISACAACAASHGSSSQTGDIDWLPDIGTAEFPEEQGPLVLVDAAHGNFHTIDGRFAAFAKLLNLDGYRVQNAAAEVTPELLDQADVYVISNALLGGDDAEWRLPAHSAFTPDEIEAIVRWVDRGGSLLLIADHMPFPGATAGLANAFGIVFYNGFALNPADMRGILSFTRASGLLAEHAITRGRTGSETIDSVTSFTGQAFRLVSGAQALLHMPDDWTVILPVEAWEFDAGTPTVSARGLVQGAVMRFGNGRVAVFGEAAMFTAQSWVRDGVVGQMGMNHPSAAENAQFVLNVMHWLTGQLDDHSGRESAAP